MTTEDFTAFIESKGFVEYDSWLRDGRTFGLRGKGDKYHCECNERPPDIHIEIHEMEINGDLYNSVDFSIIGEYHNQWVELKIYSLKFEEAFEDFDKIINRIKKMWECYCDTD